MRFFSVFRKTMLEQLRDPLGLSLSLLFAPCFVLLYYLIFPTGSTTYDVLVLNQDIPAHREDEGASINGGLTLLMALQDITYANGSPMLNVRTVEDRASAERLLRDRDADVLLIVPPDFSKRIMASSMDKYAGASLTFVGDLTNPYYAVAAMLANIGVERLQQAFIPTPRLVLVSEEALGASAARSEFEVYVPGLLVFAVMMLIFQSAMLVTREVEAGTLRRLQITRLSSFELLGGMTLSFTLLGVLAVCLTFFIAELLGFRSQGPLWIAILIGAFTTLAVIGVGLLVAACSRTVTQAFLLANFPLGLFMFFSGAVFPMPRVTLFTVAGRAIGLYDILPPTHGVAAINKVLTMGAGLSDVAFELVALLVLSAIYFAAGVWLFNRTHLKPA